MVNCDSLKTEMSNESSLFSPSLIVKQKKCNATRHEYPTGDEAKMHEKVGWFEASLEIEIVVRETQMISNYVKNFTFPFCSVSG